MGRRLKAPTAAPLYGRVRCGGRSADDVLTEIGGLLRRSKRLGRRPALVLKDVERLEGSASSLLKGLARLLVDYRECVVLKDRSGYADAFLDAMDVAVGTPQDRRVAGPRRDHSGGWFSSTQ